MTSRQLYEAVLIELNKDNAPNILLEDFNYFANKAISLYVNKRYNIYDVNQQTTDDLRVLKATALLKPNKIDTYNALSLASQATYTVTLPSDYLHILNCICIYKVKLLYKCYNEGDTWRAAATRLTADAYSQVLDNFWNKPDYKRPYYYIHNVNTVESTEGDYKYTKTTVPTAGIAVDRSWWRHYDGVDEEDNPVKYGDYHVKYIDGTEVVTKYLCDTDDNPIKIIEVSTKNPTDEFLSSKGTDVEVVLTTSLDGLGNSIGSDGSLKKTIRIAGDEDISNVERAAGTRYGNVSEVRCEIRYGTDDSIFELKQVYIDYIKAPQNIRLTQQQVDTTSDTSQMLEYPDYVCQEIINELVHIIMENISDLRILTHSVVSLSIANPAQQLAEPAAQ